jgi:hypothetical protein
MLILAYQYFETINLRFSKAELAKLLAKTALLCEGDKWDVGFFETRDDVTVPEYLK